MPQRAMDGGEANSNLMMVIFKMRFGKISDFKLRNTKIVMMEAWQIGHESVKSYE